MSLPLSRDEIRALTTPSAWRGALSVVTTWALIAAAFVMAAMWPLLIPVALVILGGRQLALAVLMHECAHRSLFPSRRANDLVGKWLCAAPVWQRLHDYRRHHLGHHNHTGTERDPDLGLVTPFPCSRGGLARKLARDLFGISGLRRVGALLLMDLGVLGYTASNSAERLPQEGRTASEVARTFVQNFGPTLALNLALAGVLVAAGAGWLYWLWLGAWLTTFSVFVRVRAIAEHACTEAGGDRWRNTRTTYAGPLARLTVAPHDVNYHLEHHLLMTVPHYRLRRAHELLRERGALEGSFLAPSYRAVLAEVSR